MEMSAAALGQAITDTGGISADWILVGITTLVFALLTYFVSNITGQIKDIKESLKDISKTLHNHDKDIALIRQKLKIENDVE